jgi:hypothetical protein
MGAGLCIGLLAATAVHVLPASAVTLRWTHTVEKTPWEEDFVIQGTTLELREARVKRSGAGMDPPPSATWSGGWWRYRPALEPMAEVTVANSEFGDGYTLCWGAGVCRPLEEFIPRGTTVKLAATPCAAEYARE